MSFRHYALLAFGALFILGCEQHQEQKAPPKPKPLPVKTITVTKEKYPLWLHYTGKTKASNEQDVRARVSGRLEKIFFKDGATVKKGEPLFLIEQAPYKAKLDAALAAKARDEATLKLTLADVARYKPLVEEGLAPRATLEQYEARRDELAAQIEADKAKIADAKLQLGYTKVVAPIAGRISARRVDVGNLVGYGESTLLTKIVRSDPLYAYFAPSEADMQFIYKNRSKELLDAYIEVGGGNEDVTKRLDGTLDFADNTVDPMTSTVTMRSKIHNPKHTILPGTFVYVHIFVTDNFDLILIPPQTILEDQLGKFVYVAKDGKAVKKVIETGYTTRYYTVVKSGLEAGEKLVVNGFMKLREGMRLQPTDVSESEGIRAIMQKNHLIPKKL